MWVLENTVNEEIGKQEERAAWGTPKEKEVLLTEQCVDLCESYEE